MGRALTPDEVEGLYGLTKAQIERLTDMTYQRIVADIRSGKAPREAISAALSAFSGPYYEIMSDALGTVLGRAMGTLEVKAWPVGQVTLSQALYRGARETAARALRVVADHLKFGHDARKLALELFEGYGFRADEVLKPAVRLPAYMRDAGLEGEVTALLARIQASRLKTAPLRAGYLQALDAILAGSGQDALDKALRVAVYERHRYFANRIAQTELHRAHTDQLARELMADAAIEIVEYRLSASHPEPDICDVFAHQDAFGLGPGLYPKAKAPKPPQHPFCRCLLRPRIDLTGSKPGKERPGAAATYLRTLDERTAARVAGSQAKRAAVLNGKSLSAVLDAGRPEGYRLAVLGDVAPPAKAP